MGGLIDSIRQKNVRDGFAVKQGKECAYVRRTDIRKMFLNGWNDVEEICMIIANYSILNTLKFLTKVSLMNLKKKIF